ncbi:MAG: hypothetical protein GVY29_12150 [Spirochaetes bacterium]|jgi:hypothetical protein|nr:hypothetical protein [Spirochaetota bacterium]
MKREPRRELLMLGVVLLCTALFVACPTWFGDDGNDDGEPAELRAPYGLTASLESDGTVLLAWDMDEDQEHDGFVIDRRTEDSDFEQIDTMGPGNTGYYDTSSLTPGTTYYYRVGIYRDGQEPCWCEEASVVTTGSSVDPEPLAPPAWIQGTWSDSSDVNTYTFTEDNVQFSTSSASLNFKELNQQWADQALTETYYYDEEPQATVYTVMLRQNGSVIQTLRFERTSDTTLNYTVDSLSSIELTWQS